VIPWVFHRGGQRIGSFRKVWLRACREAGAPGRLLHDFRRTALRNLLRAGAPMLAAMAMVGWETFAMVKRYGITDEAMLRDAAVKLAKRR
jgi:integrase